MAATAKIQVYGSSIMSSPKIRSNHEKVDRMLKSGGIEFTFYDISWDEEAKSIYKRKNGGSTELPLILSNGERCGSVEQLEEAVEFGELKQFLKFGQQTTLGGEDAALLASLSPEEAAALAAELSPVVAQHPAFTTTSTVVPNPTSDTPAPAPAVITPKSATATTTSDEVVPPSPAKEELTADTANEDLTAEKPAEPAPTPVIASGVELLGIPKDEIALKEEADNNETVTSLPTVPSADQIEAAVQENPEPTVATSAPAP